MRLLIPFTVVAVFIIISETLFLFFISRCHFISAPVRKKIVVASLILALLSGLFIGFEFYNVSLLHKIPDYKLFAHITAIFIILSFPKLITGIFGIIYFPFYSIIKRIKGFVPAWPQLAILTTGFILFVFLTSSYLVTPFRIRTNHIPLYFTDLPQAFENFRIVQISDLHAGTFGKNQFMVQRICNQIKQQKPDIIVFTGDWVNNFAEELNGVINPFYQLYAPYGKYSIWGNHDYGDYYFFRNNAEKISNHKKLAEFVSNMGFQTLEDTALPLVINNDTIFLAGVGNWGKSPFKSYGKTDKAMKLIPEKSFTIMLSHNPDHWDAEIEAYQNIKLTLSGHTHGMQFGINRRYLHFSAASKLYKYWAGLYTFNNRYLYVNVGLGCLGIRARYGMRPEITVISLHQKPV